MLDNPELHIAEGHALDSLRDESVLIVGSGMSFHDLKAFSEKRLMRPEDGHAQCPENLSA